MHYLHEQSRFEVTIKANYFTRFRDTPLAEAERKTIALAEFAKSIGLVITMTGTEVSSRYPAKES